MELLTVCLATFMSLGAACFVLFVASPLELGRVAIHCYPQTMLTAKR